MTPPFRRPSSIAVAAFVLTTLAVAHGARAESTPPRSDEERRALYFERMAADREPSGPEAVQHFTPCVDGMAGAYPCDNVDLLEYVSHAALGGSDGNDIWGWTDPVSGREFALVGQSDGTAFVEITSPSSTVLLGRLPSHTGDSTWRDLKTYQNHVFIVADLNENHGMQVFDLERLLTATPGTTFTEDAWYGNTGSVHNIAINEATGFAYLVGSSSGANTCNGGLHIVNIQNPEAPGFAGCFSADGYTHDTQCVVYAGPDVAHQGQEICFNSNEDTLTIVHVDNHAAPVQISRTPYAGSAYTHQGWLTEDHKYFLIDDELDEQSFGHNTWTYVWDVQNLEAPVLLGHFTSPTPAIDHNQYVRSNYVFQANYRSGLRVLRIDDPSTATLSQIGFFDVYPTSDTANFSGAWSVYPYFPSGNVVVNGLGAGSGLFVVRPTNLCETAAPPTGLTAIAAGDNQIDLAWTGSGNAGNTFRVERALGGCGGAFEEIIDGLVAPSYSDDTASGQVPYGYRVSEVDPTGFCRSETSACVEATTTGVCTAPPAFAGLQTATTPATPGCRVDLGWGAAAPWCGGPAVYNVYRSSDPDFVPAAVDRIAEGVTGTTYADLTPPSLETVYYVVRAVDGSNGAEEGNLLRRQARATGPVADGTFATGAEPGDPTMDTLAGGGEPESPEHAGWHIVQSPDPVHGGLSSFSSTNVSNLCVTLEGDLDLTAGQVSQLTWWHVYDIEPGWDGGVIDLSTNGGTTWTRLTPVGGYPGSIVNTGNACGIAPGQLVFNGTQSGFAQRSVDLAAYDGQAVRLRWQYSTDTSVNNGGWFVDDIAVTHVQVPSACSSSVVLIADFEEGDTSEWSSTTP
jgi:choice-of-anchor B domain-containing protein